MADCGSSGEMFWNSFDAWCKRVLTVVAVIVLIGGGFATWNSLNNRVTLVEQRVAAIERMIETKIDPMRDDLITLRSEMVGMRSDVASMQRSIEAKER
jgi:hypothetical protein